MSRYGGRVRRPPAWLLVPLLVFGCVPDWSGDVRLPLLGRDAVVQATPVPLFAGAPERRRLGALEYLRGYRLDSPDRAFGGFSAMTVDGDRFMLLSDGGNIVRFRLDAAGRLSEPGFAELPAGPRTGWRKRDRDSESIATDPATGTHWVAFENANQIWRFDAALGHATGSVAPPDMADWSDNGGAEGMARLGDGRFVVLSEASRWRRQPRGTYAAMLFDGDPVARATKAVRFAYRPPTGFNATALEPLPDGRLIALHRRVAWPGGFEAVVSIVDPAAIRAGAVVEGRVIARFPGGMRCCFGRDNFEAMAVTRDGDDVLLWIASDDNQTVAQRTTLLQFRIDPAALTR